MLLPMERRQAKSERDSVFATDNPEDLTLLPLKPFKPLGARVVLLTYAEHVELNPPDGPGSFTLGSDTQLFRDHPQTVSEVFANWEQFEAPPQKTRLEINCAEFIVSIEEQLRFRAMLLKHRDLDGVGQVNHILRDLVHSAEASGQTRENRALRDLVDVARMSYEEAA